MTADEQITHLRQLALQGDEDGLGRIGDAMTSEMIRLHKQASRSKRKDVHDE